VTTPAWLEGFKNDDFLNDKLGAIVQGPGYFKGGSMSNLYQTSGTSPTVIVAGLAVQP
jgi:hypothetical protein